MKKLKERIESLTVPLDSIDGYLEIYPDENDPDLELKGNEYVANRKKFTISLSMYTGEGIYWKEFTRLISDELMTIEADERKNLRDITRAIRKIISKADNDIQNVMSKYGYIK